MVSDFNSALGFSLGFLASKEAKKFSVCFLFFSRLKKKRTKKIAFNFINFSLILAFFFLILVFFYCSRVWRKLLKRMTTQTNPLILQILFFAFSATSYF